jgi:hypothetical protein
LTSCTWQSGQFCSVLERLCGQVWFCLRWA